MQDYWATAAVQLLDEQRVAYHDLPITSVSVKPKRSQNTCKTQAVLLVVLVTHL